MATTGYGDRWNIKDLLGDLIGASAEVKPEPRRETPEPPRSSPGNGYLCSACCS